MMPISGSGFGGGERRAQRPRDIGRKRKATVPKKRLHILVDKNLKAFPGWEKVQGTWTLETCQSFIDWCHIGKVFPLARHAIHRARRMANLKYCTHDVMVERCIQVCQHLYGEPNVPRNEVSISILRMVYAEVELGRTVDWRTMRHSTLSRTSLPETASIPNVRKFANGGLRRITAITTKDDDEIEWSATSSDDEYTGCPSEVRREIERPLKGRWLERALLDMVAEDEGIHFTGTPSGPPTEAITTHPPHSPRPLSPIQLLEEQLSQCRLEVEQCKKELEELRPYKVHFENGQQEIENLRQSIVEKDEIIFSLLHSHI